MPRQSQTDNVTKVCKCVKWKVCAHPWYLDYQRDQIRYRDNLDKLIGRHAVDFTAAKDEARRAILAKLEGRDPKGLIPDDDPTVAELLAGYDHDKPRQDRYQIKNIIKVELSSPVGLRAFGSWRMSAVTPDTLKQFRRGRPLVAGNRDLGLLRAAFNWAVLGGLVPRSPFRIGDVSAVKLLREEPRTRRLHPGEYERMMQAAYSLTHLITAALETGARKGELLSLQWHQVRFTPRAELFLPAAKTKAKRDRRVPLSSVLQAVLMRRQTDPAGDTLPPDAYVFGDEIGRPRLDIKTAWRLTLKRAEITDLHFHDLRREAGSRWMDAGIPLATIQRWLGHANISQTSTYLGASLGGDEQDMQAYETKMGRLTPLTQIDVSARSDAPEGERTDNESREKTEQNPIVH